MRRPRDEKIAAARRHIGGSRSAALGLLAVLACGDRRRATETFRPRPLRPGGDRDASSNRRAYATKASDSAAGESFTWPLPVRRLGGCDSPGERRRRRGDADHRARRQAARTTDPADIRRRLRALLRGSGHRTDAPAVVRVASDSPAGDRHLGSADRSAQSEERRPDRHSPRHHSPRRHRSLRQPAPDDAPYRSHLRARLESGARLGPRLVDDPVGRQRS